MLLVVELGGSDLRLVDGDPPGDEGHDDQGPQHHHGGREQSGLAVGEDGPQGDGDDSHHTDEDSQDPGHDIDLHAFPG